MRFFSSSILIAAGVLLASSGAWADCPPGQVMNAEHGMCMEAPKTEEPGAKSSEAPPPIQAGEGEGKLTDEQLDEEIGRIKANLRSDYGRHAERYVKWVDEVHERFHAASHEKKVDCTRADLQNFSSVVGDQAALFRINWRIKRNPFDPELPEKKKAAQQALDASMSRMMTGTDAQKTLHNIFHDVAFKSDREDGGIGGLNPDRRRRHNDEMVRTSPKDPMPLVFSGNYDLANGRASDALAKANQALALDPRNADAYSLRAAANFDMKDYPSAHKDASAALMLNPKDGAAHATLQMSAGRDAAGDSAAGREGAAGSSGGGLGFRSTALAAGSSHLSQSASFARQARSALDLRDYRDAVRSATRALELNPQNLQAYLLRAIAHNRLHDYQSALKDAEAGLMLDRKNGGLLNAKSEALSRLRRYKDALAAANLALEINPKDADAYRNRAMALAGLGDRAGMLEALRMAAQLDQRNAPFLQGALQLPEGADLMLLFPEDGLPRIPGAGGAGWSRGRRLGVVALLSVVGGFLLALGILQVFMEPLKARVRSFVTRFGSKSPAATSLASNGMPEVLKGQYRIVGQIGSGGMGMVYEGTDSSLGRRVAIKRMRDELKSNRRERERFVSEARLVAALHHPNIVDIYAIVEEGNEVYLVFEFIAGRTIHEVLAEKGPLSFAEATAVLRGIAKALDFAHGRGVIHRDLKPSNVMLDEEGYAKVMDFGIARLAKDAMSRYSMTNTIVGTPPYMAPEQEQGVVRREADVYALAICLYEMLSGRLPFSGSGAGMLVAKMNKSFPPVTSLVEGLPPGLDAVLARALDPDPDMRFHGAKELVASLDALAAVPPRA